MSLLCLWFVDGCCVYLVRGNTSVDESYEWDSWDARVDADVLEAVSFDQFPAGRRRAAPRRDQAAGLQDQQQQGERALRWRRT